MARNDNQIRVANMVYPVQHQLPEVVYSVANLPFTFQSDFLDLAVRTIMLVDPFPNGFSS
jgi:hypothetical protein